MVPTVVMFDVPANVEIAVFSTLVKFEPIIVPLALMLPEAVILPYNCRLLLADLSATAVPVLRP